MADGLGAVRRTPRPTGDRQTPETVAQLPRGATNAPTPVSTDAGIGTDDLSPEVEAALIEQHGPEIAAIAAAFDELRGKLHATAVLGHLHTTDNDMQAFLELPDCQACGGTGKDDHASPFEAPLAVHFAGPPVRAERRLRQLCMWCGHVLIDASLKDEIQLTPWSVGVFVKVEDSYGVELPHEPGGELPPGCCALPDDEPVCPCEPPCSICGATKVCEPCAADGWTACEGPHKCTCGPDRCHRLDVNGQCQHCARIGPGQGGCPAANGRAWTLGDHPADRPSEDGPDEAQETRAAADWPAEPVDTPAEGDHA